MADGKKFGIFGKKIGMTQIYSDKGAVVPVTVIDTSGCQISQLRTTERDGYAAIQVAFGERKPQNINKPQAGHFKKAGVAGKAKVGEIRVDSDESIAHLKPGDTLSASKMFQKGDFVDVSGTSKGKGFAGVIKRHNFAGTKASHGVHEFFRHGGSIGATTHPGRVLKNVGMPGQLGNEKITTQNLEVAEVREKDNLILIKGSVPGADNTNVFIRAAAKKPAPADRSWN